jgi:hypothetical protein
VDILYQCSDDGQSKRHGGTTTTTTVVVRDGRTDKVQRIVGRAFERGAFFLFAAGNGIRFVAAAAQRAKFRDRIIRFRRERFEPTG